MKIRIASIDVGKKNLAQYVEDTDAGIILDLEKKYNSLPRKFQRRVKGNMNTYIEDILEQLFLSGKKVQTGVYNLSHNNSDVLNIETRRNILSHLETYQWLWNTCDIFVIEQQFFKTWSGRSRRSTGTEANVDAIKIGEAIFMWFLAKYPFKIVMYFGSQNKTQILGAPLGMTKNQRKKWAEEKTREIYELRKDRGMIDLFKLRDRIFRKRLTSEEKIQMYLDTYPKEHPKDCQFLAEKITRERQKLDDISDACIQVQAFKFKHMVGCF